MSCTCDPLPQQPHNLLDVGLGDIEYLLLYFLAFNWCRLPGSLASLFSPMRTICCSYRSDNQRQTGSWNKRQLTFQKT